MTNNNPWMPGAGSQNVGGSVPMPGVGAPTGNDNFEVDLTNVTSGFTIPDGNYKVKCEEVEQTVSQGGNPMFVWTFTVSEGPETGFELKVFTAITPAAMWKVAETVQALGIGQVGSVVKFKRTDVIGKECGAVVEKTEYKGQERSQITRTITLKELAESRA